MNEDYQQQSFAPTPCHHLHPSCNHHLLQMIAEIAVIKARRGETRQSSWRFRLKTRKATARETRQRRLNRHRRDDISAIGASFGGILLSWSESVKNKKKRTSCDAINLIEAGIYNLLMPEWREKLTSECQAKNQRRNLYCWCFRGKRRHPFKVTRKHRGQTESGCCFGASRPSGKLQKAENMKTNLIIHLYPWLTLAPVALS